MNVELKIRVINLYLTLGKAFMSKVTTKYELLWLMPFVRGVFPLAAQRTNSDIVKTVKCVFEVYSIEHVRATFRVFYRRKFNQLGQ